MAVVRYVFLLLYAAAVVLFAIAGAVLLVLAGAELVAAIDPRSDGPPHARFMAVLESIGIITITVACFELSQTILEEEIRRGKRLSSPTRARRFISRFLVVIVVSSAVEFLTAVFELRLSDPSRLPEAATIGLTSAALLVAWGVFIRLNRAAEALEPEALDMVKAEDRQIED